MPRCRRARASSCSGSFPLAFWMEKEGYDVSYISNVDTHADAEGLLRAKGWLSVGHDEYWSLEMYNNVQAAIAAGVNVAFFSADTCMRPDPVPAEHGRGAQPGDQPDRQLRAAHGGARPKNGVPEVLKLEAQGRTRPP